MNIAERLRKGWHVIWRAALLLSCMTCPALAAEDRVVFVSTDTPPFFSASLPDNGVAGAILQLVSARAGVDSSIEYLPIKRFRKSEAAYIVGDPELLLSRRHMAVFPIALFSSALFYYKPHHDVIEYRRTEDLGGHTLGVLRGTVEDKNYLVRKGITVYEADSVESLLRMLQRGRVDFCILVKAAGVHAIRKLFPDEQDRFAYQSIPGSERPIAIMMDLDAPQAAQLAKRYGKSLRSTLESVEYQRILDAYWGKGKVPDDFKPILHGFVEFYYPTWGN